MEYKMSHEVEMIDGVAQMAYAGETPWHGLGVAVSNELSPQQMMKKAGVDWTVRKVNSFIRVDGKQKPTGDQSLIRESDAKILSTVSHNWKPVQNAEAFEFFNEFVLAGDMEMHTAGSLKDGKFVWCLAKVKSSFELFGGDRVDSYLLFSNPHVYGKSVDVKFTPIRVVCANTLSMSLGKQGNVSFKSGHAKAFDASVAKQTLGLAQAKFDRYREMAEFLGSKKFSVDNLLAYYNDVFPSTKIKSGETPTYDKLSRVARQTHDLIDTQPGAEYAKETWWQAFNSVTYMTDHVQGRTAENRLFNSWYGSNEARKIKAAEKAVAYATVS
jgi:phage/plasmid-like protein (TIGR03299 family)